MGSGSLFLDSFCGTLRHFSLQKHHILAPDVTFPFARACRWVSRLTFT